MTNRNYTGAAKALDRLMMELSEKKAAIPPHVVEDLKTGRSLSSIVQRETSDADTAAKAMAILENVEMNLLSLAASEAGKAYADEWQRKIADAYLEEPGLAPGSAQRFVTGVPKGAYWIRLQASEWVDAPDIENLLVKYALTARAEEDGFHLIYGKKDDVSAFLNEVRQEVRQQVGKMGCECGS